MTDATVGRAASPPMATSSTPTDRASPKAVSRSSRSKVDSVSSACLPHALTRLLGGGGSLRRYFPVSSPLANGKNGSSPRP